MCFESERMENSSHDPGEGYKGENGLESAKGDDERRSEAKGQREASCRSTGSLAIMSMDIICGPAGWRDAGLGDDLGTGGQTQEPRLNFQPVRDRTEGRTTRHSIRHEGLQLLCALTPVCAGSNAACLPLSSSTPVVQSALFPLPRWPHGFITLRITLSIFH